MEYQLYDLTTKKTVLVNDKDLGPKFRHIKGVIERALKELGSFGDYELNTFKVSIGFKADIFVFAVDGGIELTYKKP